MVKKFKFAIHRYEESNVCLISFYQTKSEKKILEKLKEFADIEPLDPKNFDNLMKKLKIFDFGNIKIKKFEEIYQKILKISNDKKIPIIFSSNHLITFFSSQVFKEDFSILIFDAHADLKNFYENKYSRATWLRRLLESIDSKRIFLIGIRSLEEDEKEFLEYKKIKYITSFDIKENLENSIKKINNFLKSYKSTYISFDVDVMENYLIKSNFPEAFGLNMYEIYKIINSLEIKKIVAIDFVEFVIENKESAINLAYILFQFLKLLNKTLIP
ncbi:MAG: arginase family protein [Candidatus Aenigmatarchaeota archaeon]